MGLCIQSKAVWFAPQLGWGVTRILAKIPRPDEISGLALANHLAVSDFDVQADAVAIPAQWMLRHAILVLCGKLVRQRSLHLVQAGAVGIGLFYGRDQIGK